jgi:hypothetical protein
MIGVLRARNNTLISLLIFHILNSLNGKNDQRDIRFLSQGMAYIKYKIRIQVKSLLSTLRLIHKRSVSVRTSMSIKRLVYMLLLHAELTRKTPLIASTFYSTIGQRYTNIPIACQCFQFRLPSYSQIRKLNHLQSLNNEGAQNQSEFEREIRIRGR